jgi:hypothetical protein
MPVAALERIRDIEPKALGRTGRGRRCTLLTMLAVLVSGCDLPTDAATRLAYDIEAGSSRLGSGAGATYRIRHQTPSKKDECTGPYKVQLDKAGALIVWCRDEAGGTISSHSTSYHARFADTPRTYLLDKPAGSLLIVDLERREGRAVIVDVR